MAAPANISLTQILQDSQSPIETTRRTAELQLAQAHDAQFPQYLTELARELSSEEKPEIVRQLAGIVMKNAISSNDPVADIIKREKWSCLDASTATVIRELVLRAVISPVEAARSAACQVISKIGRIDLPLNAWPNLLTILRELILINNNDSGAVLTKSAIVALGYICEDLGILYENDPDQGLPKEQRNTVLTMVTHGLRHHDPEIVAAACNAFYHVILFARENMDVEVERSFMVELILTCAKSESHKVQLAAWECIAQFITEFYSKMESYLVAIGELSMATLQKSMQIMEQMDGPRSALAETVALRALEFWNCICDVELAMAEETSITGSIHENIGFMSRAYLVLLPQLFTAMTNRAEQGNDDSEEYTLSMVSATCVKLCAQLLRDAVVDVSLAFMTENFGNADWRKREAAIMVYGSILEGPSVARLEPMIKSSFPQLCLAMRDKSVEVRDATAWTIGRIASLHINCIVDALKEVDAEGKPAGLLQLLLDVLTLDEARVVSFACFALHEIAMNIRSAQGGTLVANGRIHTCLDPWFTPFVQALIRRAQLPDTSPALRASCLEAVSEWIEAVGETEECLETMRLTLEHLVQVFQASFTMQPGVMCREDVSQLQGLLCGCISNIMGRIGPYISSNIQLTNKLFELFVSTIEYSISNDHPAETVITSTIMSSDNNNFEGRANKVGSEEDATIALGVLVRLRGENTLPLDTLTAVILRGLKNPAELRFTNACIGVVSELFNAIEVSRPEYGAHKYCVQIVEELLNLLRSPAATVSLKPTLLVSMSDMAVNMAEAFLPYLDPLLELLAQASSTEITDGPETEAWLEYFYRLRESVLDAYIGIILGARAAKRLDRVKSHVNGWLSFIESVIDSPKTPVSSLGRAIDVLTDLTTSYCGEILPVLGNRSYLQKIQQRLSEEEDSGELYQKLSFLQSSMERCSNQSYLMTGLH